MFKIRFVLYCFLWFYVVFLSMGVRLFFFVGEEATGLVAFGYLDVAVGWD